MIDRTSFAKHLVFFCEYPDEHPAPDYQTMTDNCACLLIYQLLYQFIKQYPFKRHSKVRAPYRFSNINFENFKEIVINR